MFKTKGRGAVKGFLNNVKKNAELVKRGISNHSNAICLNENNSTK